MIEKHDALHPDSARLIEAFERDGVLPYDQLGVLRARSTVAGAARLQGERAEVADVRDVLVGHGAGAIPARVYDPHPGQATPVLCYFHGGGFVTGSVQVADRACRALAVESGWTIVSLEYRLAPESPYPAALDDCARLVEWVHHDAAELVVDAARLVLCGDSAGGALAAATTHRLRATPYAPAGQLLLYPTLAPVGARRSPSITAYGGLPSLTVSSIDWFWHHYLPPSAAADPAAVPLLQTDLAGLPPTTVVVAGCDLLRDEGLDYAGRLRAAGTEVTTRVFDGAVHGFWWMDAALSQARELTAYLAADLHRRAAG